MAIITADTAEHFAAIERLARRIVPDFYAAFFGRAVGEYLVESGHTAVALSIQADRGYRHYLIEEDGRPVGYFSLGGGSQSHAEVAAGGGFAGAGAGSQGGLGGSGVGSQGHSGAGSRGGLGAGSQGRLGSVLLSHFYVLPECRGRGLGQLAMNFIDVRVAEMGVRRIELFVLRENSAAVGLYRRNGFVVAEEVLTRLGNGAVLEDYLMRKEIDN